MPNYKKKIKTKRKYTRRTESADKLKVIGDTYTIERIAVEPASLNLALDYGITVRGQTLVYGWPGSGKSSVAYHLAGTVAKKLNPKGRIFLGDFESLDRKYVQAAVARTGFSGTLEFAKMVSDKNKPRPDEERLDDVRDSIKEEKTVVALVDSVGGLTIEGEAEGSTGDANMGQLARRITNYMRGIAQPHRNRVTPALSLAVNHLKVGMRGNYTQPGGVALVFMSHNILRLQQAARFDDASFAGKGIAERVKFKAAPDERTGDNEFYYFIVAGYGLHLGLSAVYECIQWGLAQWDATKPDSAAVKMKGKTYGKFSTLIQKYTDKDLFKPFIEAARKECE